MNGNSLQVIIARETAFYLLSERQILILAQQLIFKSNRKLTTVSFYCNDGVNLANALFSATSRWGFQTFYFATGIDIFRTLVIKVKSTRTNIYKFGTKDI